jgi:hypothetical protein
MITFIIKHTTLPKWRNNSWYIFFNMPYVVYYHLANFELQSSYGLNFWLCHSPGLSYCLISARLERSIFRQHAVVQSDIMSRTADITLWFFYYTACLLLPHGSRKACAQLLIFTFYFSDVCHFLFSARHLCTSIAQSTFSLY